MPLRLLVASGLVAISLAALVGGQDADLDREAFVRSPTLPLQPTSAPLYHEALALHAPVLMTGDGERGWLACIAHELLRGDRILAFPDAGVETGTEERPGTVAPETVTAEPGQFMDLAGVLDGEGRPHLFWTEVRDDGVRLVTSLRDGERWTDPVALTEVAVRASAPCSVRRGDGSVWLAWQQDAAAAGEARTRLDVYVGRLDGAALADVHRITDRALSDRHAVLCETTDGSLWVAWTGGTARDYEIQARRLPAGAVEFGQPHNVSNDTWADDFHPGLAAAPDGGLWIAWDRLLDPARGESAKDTGAIEVSLRLAHLRPDRVRAVQVNGAAAGEIPGPGSYTRSGGRPALAVDRHGRLHVAYRYLKNHDRPVFPVCLQTFDGERFTAPVELEGSGGIFEDVALQVTPEGLRLAYHQHAVQDGAVVTPDFEPGVRTREDLGAVGLHLGNEPAPEALGTATVPLAVPPGPAVFQWTAPPVRDEPRPHPLGNVEEDPFLNGTKHHQVVQGDRTYHVYWGDLHRHSHVSTCTRGREPAPELNYEMGRDFYLYDFLALTDHAGQFTPFQFWRQSKMLDRYGTQAFCTLQGYEWANQFEGHQNVILRGRLDQLTDSKGAKRSAQGLWKTLRRDAAVSIPHHTAHVQMAYDWANFDPHFLRLVEVFQASRGSYEFPGCYRAGRSATAIGSFVHDGLDQGHEFGIVASSDHGNGTSYAAVLAESLDRESLFEALQARRTYGATTKGILVDFRVGGRLMGQSLRTDDPPQIDVRVRGVTELAEVVVYRNGEVLRTFNRPDTVVPREQQFPIEIVRGRRWRAQRPVEIRLFVDEGKFAPRVRLGKANPGPAWFSLRRGLGAMWKCPERFAGYYPAHGTYVSLTASTVSQLTIQGPEWWREVRLADVLDQELTLIGEGDQRLALRIHGGKDLGVDPAHGMGSQEFEVSFVDETAPAGESWYAMRVIQTDGEVAWSSPVFVRRTE